MLQTLRTSTSYVALAASFYACAHLITVGTRMAAEQIAGLI